MNDHVVRPINVADPSAALTRWTRAQDAARSQLSRAGLLLPVLVGVDPESVQLG